MSNDVVRWTRKSGKCSLTRKKKQICDYNDSTSSIVDPIVSEDAAINKNCDDNLSNTIKNESNNHILVNFSILPNTVSSTRNSNVIGRDTSINNTSNTVSSGTTIDSSDTELKNTSNTAISYIKCDRCRLMKLTRKFSSTNCNIYNNNNNNYKKNSTITNNSNNNDILVIMSTLIKCRSRLRAFFSVLPIIIVIFQVNFIFSDLIVNVVATDNDLYINKYNNYLVKEININNNNNNGYDYMNNVNSMSPQGGHYTPTWAVHIPNGDNNGLADEVARDHGFINLGKIFDDHYHFEHKSLVKRSVEPSHHHQNRLSDDDRVQWSKQQRAKSRQKRDFIRMRPSRTSSRAMSLVDSIQLNDPKWPQMWYLNRGGGLDMNVIPAWKEGITGKGVVVTILDDGLESDHPDLEHNYDPKASYDVNSHDEDPMPHYDMTDSNRHGTRCAGEVAATANNSLCAVGIAFGARVGGVRMLDGDVTDAVEARSLSLNPQHIDIYSASWGPDDDGKTVDGPGELASRAFIEGVTKGRSGKGSIFIWASGNGGRESDNCNCDGYTNSIWTLSISSATEEGHVPWYSEKCSSTLATTYSSGGQNEKQVVTTDLHHSCTVSHTGTSASAPLAAGIVALVLEANRNLTWRDLQHIVVRTAKPGNLKDQSWSKNGVGRRVSHSFGYGLMDAAAMVKVARTWKTVPEQQRCEINAPHVDKMIPAKSYITLQLTVKHCMGVNFLEHVQAKITLTTQRRGDIQIYLKSPSGTRVTLLTSRMHDVSRSGFNQWPFMSVHTWGEAPHGNWQLEIHNEGRYMGHAILREWSLIFYGTATPIDKNDPISIRPTSSSDLSSTSPISSLTHHQLHPPQYPRLPPSNSNSYSILVLNKQNSKLNSFLTNMNNNNNNNNSASISNSGSSNNKKQQQQQQQYQQISPFGAILNSPKKNGKNSKNNSSGGKGGNKGSGGNGNQKLQSSSTNRPNGQSNSNQAGNNSKSSFYRISTSLASASLANNNKATSTTTGSGKQLPFAGITTSSQRPKLSQHQSNYNINLNLGSTSVGNTDSKQDKTSRINEKIAIKAPKQVKDNNAYSSSSSNSNISSGRSSNGSSSTALLSPPSSSSSLTKERFENSYERISTHSQRIPKLFEKYEKIQQIFPEFHPYTGPKDNPSGGFSSSSLSLSSTRIGQNRKQPSQNYEQSSSSDSSSGSSSSSSSVSNINNKFGASTSGNGRVGSIGGTGSNLKPSRENSKKMSLNVQQNEKEKERERERNKSKERIYIPNRKSTNAQITQWDLIFYGTEKPPQPDDPVRISPGRYGGFAGELEHNHLDFDTETASGQWRNMQQVGESHVDVQRTTSNDQTGSACLDYAPDQRCIECHQTTFLYNGHCYTVCPNGTYMVPEVASFSPKTYIVEPMMMTSNERIDTYYGLNNNNTIDNFKQRAIMRPMPQKRCAQCDPSCLNCRGPNAGDCTACLPGYQLRKIFPKDTFCYYLNERSSDNSAQGGISAQVDNYDNDDIAIRDDLYMFLIIIVPAISIIFLIALLSIFGRKFNWLCNNQDNNNYSYNRVAFNIDDDEEEGHDNSSNMCAGVSKVEIDVEAQKVSKSSRIESEIKKSLINNADDSDDY